MPLVKRAAETHTCFYVLTSHMLRNLRRTCDLAYVAKLTECILFCTLIQLKFEALILLEVRYVACEARYRYAHVFMYECSWHEMHDAHVLCFND
jgi:hypothetical protein